jgi:nitrile hydratase accessory protein
VSDRQTPVSPGVTSERLDEQGPTFDAPWEAHAFAITLTLYEQGHFTWPEWTSNLAAEIEHAQREDDHGSGETYYHHWLAALERLVAERGITDQTTLARYRDAWARAAQRTPHGTPIELAPQDLVTE